MTVDLIFSIRGTSIPRDHGFALWRELRNCLPWLDAEDFAGIHAIRGAPANDEMLLLTQRTKLVLRLPRARVADAQSLQGRQLDLGGYVLQIGASRQRPLLAFATLYSQLVCTGSDDELEFHRDIAAQLGQLDVACKFICGKQRALRAEQTELRGYSLMLHDLALEQSTFLQQVGLGEHRKLGCGIFVPHKSIAAVAA
ncbi:MAG: type I-MYXAN CRISPR-associated protein Cas6/Cmx6 [Betaproteobacteria bacterium]|nr:type I-MYXAN CRISPR-associated protein Cas6/Cmx6 [Betaproteobacteria bacterium]MBI2292447.1 type I-MYXAN CRISPR-associated protein Cas6/Cmx6 [Betaproteobacteria bacterium]MBI3057306.1 type I-MYXAN CRISPR-associated protein Cas6/Cmx6 [Betaproteobacteria bacterium]